MARTTDEVLKLMIAELFITNAQLIAERDQLKEQTAQPPLPSGSTLKEVSRERNDS